MPVRVHARSRVIVIAASGDLDLVSRALMDAAVDSTLNGSWPVIVVDLAGLQFIDVMGARPIRRLVTGVEDTRLPLIVGAGREVERTLRLLDLGRWIVPLEELPLATDEDLNELLRQG